ncbi:TCR/Tet family MFS transporter [Leadbetterella byssophila]|uniref:TCR/Tet family MFS transporter n=1 Tax=Leadbetterella byssophila TaxID=316068 RepID=UPI0039A0C275
MKKAGLAFILVTVLIDVIGIGLIIPIMPALYQELTGGTISESSTYSAYLVFAYSLMQFIFSPIIGGLSDQYGRRPILLLSLFGFGLNYLFMALAPSLVWLFVGRIISGITGASFATANAYIADISSPEKRAQNFGLVGAMFGIGFIIGPALGGLLGELGTRVPFYVAGALSLANWLYGYFFLPESLVEEKRRKFDFSRSNPLGSVMNLKKNKFVFALVTALFLVYVSGFAVQGTWAFYTIEKFHWSEAQIGISLAVLGLLGAIVQGGLIRYAIPKFGAEKALFLGLACNMIGQLGFGLVADGWMLYAAMAIHAISGLANPAFQGIITAKVAPNEQGELQGGLTSLMSIAAIVGQPLMLGLFRMFTKEDAPVYFPGMPFLVGAILSAASIILTLRIISRKNFANEN